jgi:hypothetical protein
MLFYEQGGGESAEDKKVIVCTLLREWEKAPIFRITLFVELQVLNFEKYIFYLRSRNYSHPEFSSLKHGIEVTALKKCRVGMIARRCTI